LDIQGIGRNADEFAIMSVSALYDESATTVYAAKDHSPP